MKHFAFLIIFIFFYCCNSKAQEVFFPDFQELKWNDFSTADSILRSLNYKFKGAQNKSDSSNGYIFYQRKSNSLIKLDGIYIIPIQNDVYQYNKVASISTSDKLYNYWLNKCRTDTFYFMVKQGIIDDKPTIVYCNTLNQFWFIQGYDSDYGTIYITRLEVSDRECDDKFLKIKGY